MWIKKHVLDKNEKTAYTGNKQSRGDDPLRIAICDDESTHRDTLMAAISYSDELPENAVIMEYSTGNKLLHNHTKCPFDIIFLDIEMDGMTGLEAGQEIRNNDRNVIIIYLTSFKDYVFESLKMEPFDYILKPVDNKKINEVLGRALKKYREQHYIVSFKWQEMTYALRVCDIVYLASNLRHIEFITVDNRYKCIGKLNDYMHRLAPYGFLRCHQSYLINMSFIKSIEKREIFTTLGNSINMSANKKQRCLDIFNEYLTKYRV